RTTTLSPTDNRPLSGGPAATTIPPRVVRTANRRVLPGTHPGITTQSPSDNRPLSGGSAATTIPPRVASLEASGLVPRATPCLRFPVLPSRNVQDGKPPSPSRHPSRNHYPVPDRQPATLGRPRRDHDSTSSS